MVWPAVHFVANEAAATTAFQHDSPPLGRNGPAQHREERRRGAGLDRAQQLEAMPLIKRDVIGVCRFEIRGGPVAIAGDEPMLQQRRTVAAALSRRVTAAPR